METYKLARLKTSPGFGIVEALVAMGIIAIVAAGISNLLLLQSRETRSIQEKLSAIDLEKLLISTFSDGTICTHILADSSYDVGNPKTFDETLIATATPPTVVLSKLVASTVSTSSDGIFLVQSGSPLLGQTRVVVDQIRITDIKDQGGSNYLANIEVSFDGSKLVRPLRSIKISTLLKTDSSSPRKILECIGAASMGPFANLVVFTSNSSWTVPATTKRIKVEAWGAGGGGGGSAFNGSVTGGGGGGTGGAYAAGIYPVVVGDIIDIDIGVGGLGGATNGIGANASNGVDGGNTKVLINGVLMIGANGGLAGTGSIFSPTHSVGANSGPSGCTGGQVCIGGQAGGFGMWNYTSNTSAAGGGGGGSPNGGAGGLNGNVSGEPGGGGSGGVKYSDMSGPHSDGARSGGAGAKGRVQIWY